MTEWEEQGKRDEGGSVRKKGRSRVVKVGKGGGRSDGRGWEERKGRKGRGGGEGEEGGAGRGGGRALSTS